MCLTSGIRGCADKLGGGGERCTVRRTANRQDGNGDGEFVRLKLPLFGAAMMVRTLTPQTNRRGMTKRRGAGRKNSQVPLCASNWFLILILDTWYKNLGRVKGAAYILVCS